MSFLTIPIQEGLFTTVRAGKEAQTGCPNDNNNNNDDEEDEGDDDDDDDDDTGDVRLIPRCSPVPRKRGASIYDETAEYLRIHQALSAGKRVSFADTTGGDLVDVKEFVAFDSDDEEESARWEEEEAKYRKQERAPVYHLQPEFRCAEAGALLQAVRANKVEVERVQALQDEPLAFSGVIRVLNVSFHKAVYIRSTMDAWATYYDHPAEYVQGSNDGDTDRFSFKLSFAPPYITHGSRIEFVVRYETSDGDYWANNSSMNYVVTLLLTYEDVVPPQTHVDMRQVKGILRPPKDYSGDFYDSEDELEKIEAEAGTSASGLVRPTAVRPTIVQPQIDVEIAVHPSGPSVPPNQELPSVDGTLSAHIVSPGEHFPCMSSETTLQTNLSFVLCARESVRPDKSQPLPRLHCELGNQTSEQPMRTGLLAPLPASTASPQQEQESGQRSDSPGAGGEEIPPSEAPSLHPPTTEASLWPATREDASTPSPAGHPRPEPRAENASAPSVTQGLQQEDAVGLRELAAGLSEGSTGSAAHHEGSTPALSSPVAQSQASLGTEGEAPAAPELTENPSVSTGAADVSQNAALQSVSAREGREDAPQISPDALLENPPNALSEFSELRPERDVIADLMPSFIFLSGVVSLSVVVQEPGALFFIALLLVLHRL